MAEQIKIVFLGDCGVGKTSIIHAFCGQSSADAPSPTVGVENTSRTIPGRIGPVQLRLFDTAGQERYRALTPLYVKSANVAVMVFDLTDLETLKNLEDSWYPLVSQHAPQDCIRVLVGNKSDLLVNTSDWDTKVDSVMERLEAATVFNVSALEKTGIDELFRWIANDERIPRDQSYQKDVSIETRLLLAEKKECC
jgi:small GTP-binding protein